MSDSSRYCLILLKVATVEILSFFSPQALDYTSAHKLKRVLIQKIMRSKNRHIILLSVMAAVALSASGCGQSNAPLPVAHAPQREEAREVPADGIIRIEAGDTIYRIANRYGIDPRKIILSNNLSPPYVLGGLATLTLPKPRNHTINPGDSIQSVSDRYAVTAHELIRINRLEQPYTLRPGTTLLIPRQLDYSMLDFPENEGATQAETEPATQAPATTANATTTTTTSATAANAAARIAGAPDFTWPVNGDVIERFGHVAKGVQNDGVNITAALGTPVAASSDGTVAFVGKNLKSFGNMILIKHKNGWITAYAHLDDITVTEGQDLAAGTVIGSVGDTGKVNVPQLHFQIRKSRTPVNPEHYVL